MFLVLMRHMFPFEFTSYLVLALLLTAGAAFVFAAIDAGPLHQRRRRRILAARALGPLDPTLEEIQEGLDNLRRGGAGLGRRLRARRLRACLDGV
jgi:hypothetical protein